MNYRKSFSIACIAMSAATAYADPLATMNGVGTLSCGKYLESEKNENAAQRMLYQQWIAGYIAGYSASVTEKGKSAALSADLETYTAWMDKWCADHPLGMVSGGAWAFIKIQRKK